MVIMELLTVIIL